jgi:hypothetical protein
LTVLLGPAFDSIASYSKESRWDVGEELPLRGVSSVPYVARPFVEDEGADMEYQSSKLAGLFGEVQTFLLVTP